MYLHFPDLHQFFIRQTSTEKVNNVLDLVTVLDLINVTFNARHSKRLSVTASHHGKDTMAGKKVL